MYEKQKKTFTSTSYIKYKTSTRKGLSSAIITSTIMSHGVTISTM